MKLLITISFFGVVFLSNFAVSQSDSIKVEAIISKIESLDDQPEKRMLYVSQIDHLYTEAYSPQLFKYVKREYDKAKNTKPDNLKFDIYHLMEATYYAFGDFDKASVIAYDLLKIAQATKDSTHYYFAYSSIAGDEDELGDINTEIEFLLLAKRYAESDPSLLAKVNIELGIVFLKQKDYPLAKRHFLDAIRIAKQAKNKTQLIYAYAEIMAYHSQVKEYDKALEYYRLVTDAINSDSELSRTRDLIQVTLEAIRIYLDRNQLSKAETTLNFALEYASESSDKDILSEAYNLFSELEEKKGNLKQSLIYYKKYSELQVQIYNEESRSQLNNLKISYEFEKKEKELETSRMNEEFAKKKAGYITIIAIIAGITLIVAIFLLRFKLKNALIQNRLVKAKSKMREIEVEKLEQEIELKNKELADVFLHQYEKAKLINDLVENIDQSNKSLKEKILNHQSRSNDWTNFKSHFNKVHEGFFDTLNSLSSELTPKDIRFCAYLRMNLSTKEIAIMLGISHRTVEGIRRRVRKKLKLEAKDDLVKFLMNI